MTTKRPANDDDAADWFLPFRDALRDHLKVQRIPGDDYKDHPDYGFRHFVRELFPSVRDKLSSEELDAKLRKEAADREAGNDNAKETPPD